MKRAELKQLKSVGYDSKVYSTHYGQENLVPGANGLEKVFKPFGDITRYWSIKVRYNGDEVVLLFRAYAFPGSIDWWYHSAYNMRTRRKMRDKPGQDLFMDVMKRATVKSYQTDGVLAQTIQEDHNGNTRKITYKDHIWLLRPIDTSKHPETDQRWWISFGDDRYWGLARSIKEAKIEVHKRYQEILLNQGSK